MQARTVGLNRRAQGDFGGDALALCPHLGAQPVEPRRQASAAPGRQLEHRRRVGERAQVGLGARGIEIVQHRQQVGLGEQQQVGGAEHHRILRRLVVALGGREQRHVAVLAEVETRGTDEIADILDEQDIQTRQLHMVQGVVHHVRVEMAGGAGGDLVRRHALGADARGVVLGFEVALDDGQAQFIPQRAEGGFKQQRLAGAGRGHEVDDEHAVFVEVLAVVRRLAVVFGQQIGEHAYRALAVFVLLLRQILVGVGDVAAAGITHNTSQCGMRNSECGIFINSALRTPHSELIRR